jgi:hypothetical protein
VFANSTSFEMSSYTNLAFFFLGCDQSLLWISAAHAASFLPLLVLTSSHSVWCMDNTFGMIAPTQQGKAIISWFSLPA